MIQNRVKTQLASKKYSLLRNRTALSEVHCDFAEQIINLSGARVTPEHPFGRA